MDNPMAAFQVEGMTKWGRNNVFGQVKQRGCYRIITSSAEEGIYVDNKQHCIQRLGERKGNGNTIPDNEEELKDLERALDHGVSNVSFGSHMTSLR